MTSYVRTINCSRCGPLMTWNWKDLTKEDIEAINRKERTDPTIVFNAQALFATLSKHASHQLLFIEAVLDSSPASSQSPEKR